MVDLVKVEDLGLKLLMHAFVHVGRDLGQAEIDNVLNKLVGVRNLVDMAVFIFTLSEPVFLCNTLFLDP